MKLIPAQCSAPPIGGGAKLTMRVSNKVAEFVFGLGIEARITFVAERGRDLDLVLSSENF